MSAQTVHRLGAPRNRTGAASNQKKLVKLREALAADNAGEPPEKYTIMNAMAEQAKKLVSRPAWCFFDTVAKYAGPDKPSGCWFAYPAISTIAAEMGVSERQAYRLKNECEKAGLLTYTPGGGRVANTYLVNYRPWLEQAERELAARIGEDDDSTPTEPEPSPQPCRDRHPNPAADDRSPLTSMTEEHTKEPNQKNKPSNTTPQPHDDDDDDDGCGGGGGGVDALVQLEIRNPTRDELASNPRLTPEVIEIIARKIRRSGGKVGATVQALRDPVEIDAAERELKEERERVERAEARRVAEETERAERERAEVIEQDRRTVRDILAKPDGPEYIERVRGKINKAEGDRFANTDMMSDTADAAELRRIIAGRASGALAQTLSTEATDDELWRATQGTPASIVRRDIKAGRLSYHDLSAIRQHIDQQRTATAAS